MAVPIRFTIKDLDLFPEPLDDTRYEIIDGELHVSKQPIWEHQDVCSEVLTVLRAWSRETGLGRAVLAPGVVFAEDEAVAPDLVWISNERLEGALDESKHLRIAPELVVEVLSPGAGNAHRDRALKLDLYSRYGVLEYWIVDWQRRSVAVYRREHAGLRIASTLDDSDVLESPLLPGFSCPVSRFFS